MCRSGGASPSGSERGSRRESTSAVPHGACHVLGNSRRMTASRRETRFLPSAAPARVHAIGNERVPLLRDVPAGHRRRRGAVACARHEFARRGSGQRRQREPRAPHGVDVELRVACRLTRPRPCLLQAAVREPPTVGPGERGLLGEPGRAGQVLVRQRLEGAGEGNHALQILELRSSRPRPPFDAPRRTPA